MNTVNSQFKTQAKSVRLFNRATVSAAVLAAVIFILDLLTSQEIGIGMLYVAPLLVGTLSGPPRFQLVAAAVASALTVAGAMLPPHGALTGIVIVNRTIALTVIWTTAIVL